MTEVSNAGGGHSILEPALKNELEAFILREAQLLDENKYEEWFELFADDGVYWASAKAGQKSPNDHVSYFMMTRLHY